MEGWHEISYVADLIFIVNGIPDSMALMQTMVLSTPMRNRKRRMWTLKTSTTTQKVFSVASTAALHDTDGLCSWFLTEHDTCRYVGGR